MTARAVDRADQTRLYSHVHLPGVSHVSECSRKMEAEQQGLLAKRPAHLARLYLYLKEVLALDRWGQRYNALLCRASALLQDAHTRYITWSPLNS